MLKELDAACAKLAAEDDEGALEDLLVAWREKRTPRIADVIDRVSERITKARGPIKAKSVKARTEAWLTRAKKKDAADVGVLLATPWPGRWQDAIDVLNPLIGFPSDPRIAMALARVLEETPFDTWTSHTFWAPLLRCMDDIADPRTEPILAADLKREKSRYWRNGTQPLVERSLGRIQRQPALDLTAEEEASITALEALFAGDVKRDKADAKGEADFLAAIYEAPDDDGPRVVYADWLTEHGNPRGEFISLQLSEPTEQSRKRELTLLRKHAKTWLGPLDRVLHKNYRVFERGFLTSATIDFDTRSTEAPVEMQDPGLATLRHADFSWNVMYRRGIFEAVMDLPALRFLRGIGGLREPNLLGLMAGEPRPLIEAVDFALDRERLDMGRDVIGDGKGLPNLRRIGIEGEVGEIAWLLKTPLGRRLEKLTTIGYRFALAELLNSVRKEGADIAELGARSGPGAWEFILRRDESGQHTRLHGSASGRTGLPSATELNQLLTSLASAKLTELVIEAVGKVEYSEREIEQLEKVIADTTTLATVRVPWTRLASNVEKAPTPFAFQLCMRGQGLGKTPIRELWALVTEPPLSLTLDSYALNYGGHQPLGDDPIGRAEELLAKKRTTALRLYRQGTSNSSELEVRGDYLADVTWPYEAGKVDEQLDWLVRFLDSYQVDSGEAPFQLRTVEGTTAPNYTLRNLDPWNKLIQVLWVLGPKEQELVSFDELEQAPFDWMRVRRGKRNIVLMFGGSPSEPPSMEQQTAFADWLMELVWQKCRRDYGHVPHELFLEIVGPALAKHGFEQTALPDRRNRSGELLFTHHHATGKRAFFVVALTPSSGMEFRVLLRQAFGKPEADLSTWGESNRNREVEGALPANTLAAARASLESIVARLDTDYMPWFDAAEAELNKPKKKKR